MTMDTSKKYMYFNPTTDSVAAAVSVPVSGFVGMEVTSTSNIIMYFREATDTDTLDITITRETSSDPKLVMEEIVNAINFSKDSTVVVADNFRREYVSSKLTEISSLSDGSDTPIKFQGHVQSTITSANAAGPGAPERASNVGEVNSEIITTFFIDLATASTTSTASATADHAIGVTGGGNAYITQVTEAVNGVVYAAELICVETPAGASTTIGLSSSSSGSVEQGDDATGTERITQSVQAKGDRTQINSVITTGDGSTDNKSISNVGIPDNRYLYLYHGAGAAGDYTAGKFVLRLYGAKTSGL
jgi:hypothetical protein